MNETPKIKSAFPDILSDIISDSGKTLREIARESGIGPSQLSAYQSGTNEPNMSTLLKLSNYFNVSVDFLVGKDTAITRETKIGYMRDFTGLTKAAIQKLDHIKINNPEYSVVFSIFVENFNFEYFLHLLINRFRYSASEYNVRAIIKTEDGVDHLKNAKEFHDSVNKREVHIQFDNVNLTSDKKALLDSMITNTLISDMKEMAKTYLERLGKKGGK